MKMFLNREVVQTRSNAYVEDVEEVCDIGVLCRSLTEHFHIHILHKLANELKMMLAKIPY